ncbi:MAG TPA: AGE family epimerase/isomerase [Roseiarcus sp.]|nr:AGE family epimerase/isomerase [Roseiarcus sp.]
MRREADSLFAFFEAASLDPGGGFFQLDDAGLPLAGETERALHATSRMVHCYAIGCLLGRPGASDLVDHGVATLIGRHRDGKHGGYFWSFDANGPRETSKLAYGHAFVLLAAASAKCAGHPRADWLIGDVSDILEAKFWEPAQGVSADEFAADWSPISAYRGQNSNMHLTEALMAAFEASGERTYLTKAESIADFLLRRSAAANHWRVPEHYHADWSLDRLYKGSDVFRPYGTTPGHSLEWARLALQLWKLGGRRLDWLPGAARALFSEATASAWDERGGFYYTLDWDGAPLIRDRLWWPCCEGIGAASFLHGLEADPRFEVWYRRIWDFAARRLIDRREGGWRPQLGDDLLPKRGYFVGKPDIYHALQACLIPLYPTNASLTREIAEASQGRSNMSR